MTEYQTFEEFGLNDNIKKGIYKMGWEKPSYIQSLAIPKIIEKTDVILQAQSGMGKTGAFTIGLLHNLASTISESSVQGIVVCNTRELALQIFNVISSLSEYLQINVLLYIGGTSKNIRSNLIYPQNCTIFVGTPGKLNDILMNKLYKTQPLNIKYLIIDEFDETLKFNFQNDIINIIKSLSNTSQIVLSSATRNLEVDEFTQKFMNNPSIIILKEEDVSLDGIDQYYVHLENKNQKFDCIIDLFDQIRIAQCIVFCNTKKECNYLFNLFKKKDNKFSLDILHGDMTQDERNNVLNLFRNNKIRILLSTGIISRGIDINTISLVVNYDLPYDSAEYIHRIGRTGRYGKKGLSINLITDSDKNTLNSIEKMYNIEIKELPEPSVLNEMFS